MLLVELYLCFHSIARESQGPYLALPLCYWKIHPILFNLHKNQTKPFIFLILLPLPGNGKKLSRMAFTEVNISRFSFLPSQYFPWTHSAVVSLGVKYKATETYWTYWLPSKMVSLATVTQWKPLELPSFHTWSFF